MAKRRTIFLAALAAAAAALPAVWMGSASATGAPTAGVVHLYQVNDSIGASNGTVTLTGAIGDYGCDMQGAGGGDINVLYFPSCPGDPGGETPQRSFALDLTNFGRGNRPLSLNETNCSFTSVLIGSVPIVPNSPTLTVDTGAYKNISGIFQVKATFAGVVPGQPGLCDFSQAGYTDTGLYFAEATGVISGLRG
jgi:hypothetical protein